jgi:hypothetical protein
VVELGSAKARCNVAGNEPEEGIYSRSTQKCDNKYDKKRGLHGRKQKTTMSEQEWSQKKSWSETSAETWKLPQRFLEI